MQNIHNDDLLRIINYLSIREINSELKERQINTDDLTTLECLQLYAEQLSSVDKIDILASYKYSISPLSIRLVKYKKSSSSQLLTRILGDWTILNGYPEQYNDKIIYKLERSGYTKVIKDGWNLRELTTKEALFVIDRFNENILELRGPIKSLKSLIEQFSRQLEWEDYKILEFSNEELKSILDELNALVEEMQLDIASGCLLTSLRLSNKGNETGIDYNQSMRFIIGSEEEDRSEIDLNQEATNNNFWFKGSNYTGYISKNGTFHTKNLLSEYQIEQIINKILEVKYKTIMQVNASFLEADDKNLYALYKFFVNNTTYNSLSRFSTSYFAKRINVSEDRALTFLLELVEKGTLEIKYEVICDNPDCNRITYSGSSLEEVKRFGSNCHHCGHHNGTETITDGNINIYFKVSGVVNIPLKASLTEKDKLEKDTQQSLLDLFKKVDQLKEECVDFFADKEYYKIKKTISMLESFNNDKAYDAAQQLKKIYKSILN